jgi:hypothetical protein
MRIWFEQFCIRWLTDRGYWVMKASVPCLVMTHAVGTFTTDEHGTTYHIRMPSDHKVWALLNTVLTPAKPKR